MEFEPSATALEQEGTGYVVASLGVDSGYIPYTAFCAKKSYIAKNSSVIQSFTDALQKGMEYVTEHTPEEIAKVIQPQFSDTDLDTITTIVTRYYDQETWKSDLILTADGYNLILEILKEAGVLDEEAPYENLVTTNYAEKAAR